MSGAGALHSAGQRLPDWRDAAAYQGLLPLDAAGLAWEWLRRDPQFVEAAMKGLAAHEPEDSGDSLRFSLHAWEDPRLTAGDARPVWSAPADGWVLKATAHGASVGEDCLDLATFEPLVKIVSTGGSQHVLLSDGCQGIRLDVTGVSLDQSPVRLSFLLSGIRDLRRPLIVLQRLRSLVVNGRFPSGSRFICRRSRRIVTLLRALDGLRAGASHAEIASVLLSRNLDRQGWRVHSPSIRSQAQRLAKSARRMAGGGFWRLIE